MRVGFESPRSGASHGQIRTGVKTGLTQSLPASGHDGRLMPDINPRQPSYLILGAGLAGLSLADALLRQGVCSPIVIADARDSFGNDRTWGFWDVYPHPYRSLVTRRWQHWSFASREASYLQSSTVTPYCYLPADRFYEDALTRVHAAPNCTLLLGTTIGRVVEEAIR